MNRVCVMIAAVEVALVIGASTLANAGSPVGAEPNFIRDVIPVLTKAGCNGGACHGAFSGRGGFRLSLLGFDPEADFDALVRDGRGRRTSASAPENSLLLRKTGGAISHGGGLRIVAGSESHTIMRNWLIRGAPVPDASYLHVTALKVEPADAILTLARRASEGVGDGEKNADRPSLARRVSVRAIWSDGVVQDVTKWVLFDSGDNNVAEVSHDGTITAKGPGRMAITVRFMGQVASVSVTVPFANLTDFPAFATANFIDEHVLAEWKKVGLIPAAVCDDATFLRRVSLDLIGLLPTPIEVREFLSSNDPQKRAKVTAA